INQGGTNALVKVVSFHNAGHHAVFHAHAGIKVEYRAFADLTEGQLQARGRAREQKIARRAAPFLLAYDRIEYLLARLFCKRAIDRGAVLRQRGASWILRELRENRVRRFALSKERGDVGKPFVGHEMRGQFGIERVSRSKALTGEREIHAQLARQAVEEV